ncbi:MAG: hypothetical protein AAF628_28990 [Planctomycetota bacterium]
MLASTMWWIACQSTSEFRLTVLSREWQPRSATVAAYDSEGRCVAQERLQIVGGAIALPDELVAEAAVLLVRAVGPSGIVGGAVGLHDGVRHASVHLEAAKIIARGKYEKRNGRDEGVIMLQGRCGDVWVDMSREVATINVWSDGGFECRGYRCELPLRINTIGWSGAPTLTELGPGLTPIQITPAKTGRIEAVIATDNAVDASGWLDVRAQGVPRTWEAPRGLPRGVPDWDLSVPGEIDFELSDEGFRYHVAWSRLPEGRYIVSMRVRGSDGLLFESDEIAVAPGGVVSVGEIDTRGSVSQFRVRLSDLRTGGAIDDRGWAVFLASGQRWGRWEAMEWRSGHLVFPSSDDKVLLGLSPNRYSRTVMEVGPGDSVVTLEEGWTVRMAGHRFGVGDEERVDLRIERFEDIWDPRAEVPMPISYDYEVPTQGVVISMTSDDDCVLPVPGEGVYRVRARSVDKGDILEVAPDVVTVRRDRQAFHVRIARRSR